MAAIHIPYGNIGPVWVPCGYAGGVEGFALKSNLVQLTESKKCWASRNNMCWKQVAICRVNYFPLSGSVVSGGVDFPIDLESAHRSSPTTSNQKLHPGIRGTMYT